MRWCCLSGAPFLKQHFKSEQKGEPSHLPGHIKWNQKWQRKDQKERSRVISGKIQRHWKEPVSVPKIKCLVCQRSGISQAAARKTLPTGPMLRLKPGRRSAISCVNASHLLWGYASHQGLQELLQFEEWSVSSRLETFHVFQKIWNSLSLIFCDFHWSPVK